MTNQSEVEMNTCVYPGIWIISGLSRRCFECRSRGVMGDCKDPFASNETTIGSIAVKTTPCPSGWCSKYVEGITGPPDGNYSHLTLSWEHSLKKWSCKKCLISSAEFGTATQRECMVFPPTDGEERCAVIPRNNKKTYACFCQGDLCNAAQNTYNPFQFLLCFSAVLIAASGTLFQYL